MRTQRELYTEKRVVFEYERDECLQCGQPLTTAYTSGWKTVQTMSEVIMIAQQPKRSKNMECHDSISIRSVYALIAGNPPITGRVCTVRMDSMVRWTGKGKQRLSAGNS